MAPVGRQKSPKPYGIDAVIVARGVVGTRRLPFLFQILGICLPDGWASLAWPWGPNFTRINVRIRAG